MDSTPAYWLSNDNPPLSGAASVEPADMESYPLLPPHRVQYFPTDLLLQAQADIAPLCGFVADADQGGAGVDGQDELMGYARKQYTMVAEVLGARDPAARAAAMAASEQQQQHHHMMMMAAAAAAASQQHPQPPDDGGDAQSATAQGAAGYWPDPAAPWTWPGYQQPSFPYPGAAGTTSNSQGQGGGPVEGASFPAAAGAADVPSYMPSPLPLWPPVADADADVPFAGGVADADTVGSSGGVDEQETEAEAVRVGSNNNNSASSSNAIGPQEEADSELADLLAWAYPGYAPLKPARAVVPPILASRRPESEGNGSGGGNGVGSASTTPYVAHTSSSDANTSSSSFSSSARASSAPLARPRENKRAPRHKLALAWHREQAEDAGHGGDAGGGKPTAVASAAPRVLTDFVVTGKSRKAGKGGGGSAQVQKRNAREGESTAADGVGAGGQKEVAKEKEKKKKKERSGSRGVSSGQVEIGSERIGASTSSAVPAVSRPRKPPVPSASPPPKRPASSSSSSSATLVPEVVEMAAPTRSLPDAAPATAGENDVANDSGSFSSKAVEGDEAEAQAGAEEEEAAPAIEEGDGVSSAQLEENEGRNSNVEEETEPPPIDAADAHAAVEVAVVPRSSTAAVEEVAPEVMVETVVEAMATAPIVSASPVRAVSVVASPLGLSAAAGTMREEAEIQLVLSPVAPAVGVAESPAKVQLLAADARSPLNGHHEMQAAPVPEAESAISLPASTPAEAARTSTSSSQPTPSRLGLVLPRVAAAGAAVAAAPTPMDVIRRALAAADAAGIGGRRPDGGHSIPPAVVAGSEEEEDSSTDEDDEDGGSEEESDGEDAEEEASEGDATEVGTAAPSRVVATAEGAPRTMKESQQPPAPTVTDYSDIFPEFRAVFTGCAPSSLFGGIAGGGFSATSKVAKGREAATSPEIAAAHIGALCHDWRLFLAGGQAASAAAERLTASGPAYKPEGPSASALLADALDASSGGGRPFDSRPSTAGTASSDDSGLEMPTVPAVALRSLEEARARQMERAQHAPQGVTARRHPLRLIRVMQDRPEVYEVVARGLAGFEEWAEMPQSVGTAPVFSLLWSWSRPPVQRNLLLTWQKVNHFRNANEITRKDLLKKNLSRYQCLGGKMAAAFALQPPTFVLPQQYLQFCDAFGRGAGLGADPTEHAVDNMTRLINKIDAAAAAAAASSSASGLGAAALPTKEPNIWIMKPVGLSRGRGIRVINDIGQVRYSEDTVIQKYLSNPLLLDGYKFDLRVYVLVTSFAPLEAFIYRRGFARMSSRPFSIEAATLADRFIHLTNAAVQRQSGEAGVLHCFRDASPDEAGGTKCSFEYLWRRLSAMGIDTEALWESVCDLVVKSLVCADDVIPHQPNSFEVYGYDVIFDSKLRPWLLEVNSSPSMETDSPMDVETKSQLMKDTIALVDPLAFNHEALLAVLQRRAANSDSAARRGLNAASAASGFGSGAGQVGRISAADRAQLNADLDAVLYGRRPRQLGELPSRMGAYQRICPGSESFNRVMRLKLGHLRGGQQATGVVAGGEKATV